MAIDALPAWRLLKLQTHDAFMNMAIDEAMLRARIENRVPNTLRFYRWKPSAVSIGKFQTLEKEVSLEGCGRFEVDVVRRITGGGAVYHDAEGEITYSVAATKMDFGTEDVSVVYIRIYEGIAEALRNLGIDSDFNEGSERTCPNLTVGGKKISGSAQAHKKGIVLQHGTLLLDVNLERMFTVLRVPWAKTPMEVLDIARNRITSVNAEVGKDVSTEDVSNALIEGFRRGLNIEPVNGQLTSHELECAEELCEKKYITDEWNFRGKASSKL